MLLIIQKIKESTASEKGFEMGRKVGFFIGENMLYILLLVLLIFLFRKYYKKN